MQKYIENCNSVDNVEEKPTNKWENELDVTLKDLFPPTHLKTKTYQKISKHVTREAINHKGFKIKETKLRENEDGKKNEEVNTEDSARKSDKTLSKRR